MRQHKAYREHSPWKSWYLGHILMAFSAAGAALAQGHPSSEGSASSTINGGTPKSHPAPTKADVYGAIKDAESLSQSLQEGLETYHKNLKKAMQAYGRDFHDPEYKQQLAGFDRDIQTGDAEQSRKMKLALFAAMMWTAGIRLDPDPFRCWVDIEERLDSYPATIGRARELMAQTNVFAAIGRENIPAKELLKLRTQWRAAEQQVEQTRDRTRAARPAKLQLGQTLAVQATEGYNLHFNFFGIEFGRELGNVTTLAQLTHSGRIEAGHVFLLTVLTARHGKTRVDTVVKPRAILMHSDTRDTLRYGYAVTIHNYDGYRASGARVADVAAVVRDWIWKVPPTPKPATPPSLSELEEMVGRVRESRPAIDRAIDAFQQLAAKAVRQNDATLEAEAKSAHQRARLPEQDLRASFPGVRARLHAARAIFAGDPRFLAAREAVASALRQAGGSIQQARELFSYFNAIPVHSAPALPWKRIDKLAVDLMIAAEDAVRAGARSDEFLPPIRTGEEVPVIARTNPAPGVIVAQVNRGHGEKGEPEVLILEHIVRDVHWAIKGIDRKEYTSEIIRTSSATGIHQVQGVLGPNYIQGPGGIGQVFRRILEEGEFVRE